MHLPSCHKIPARAKETHFDRHGCCAVYRDFWGTRSGGAARALGRGAGMRGSEGLAEIVGQSQIQTPRLKYKFCFEVVVPDIKLFFKPTNIL